MLVFDLLYFIFLVLAVPLRIKILTRKDYRTLLAHRLSPNVPADLPKQNLWIHAVSVGEVKSLNKLIRRLKEQLGTNSTTDSTPNTGIVLSVTTPAGYQCARREYPDITVINSPVDFSFTIKKFLDTINPRALILNELEMWPNWVSITHRRNIPIILINGRISTPAFKRYRRGMFLLKHFFNKIDRFLVQAEIYRQRFRELGIPADKIHVCGNIKADEAFDQLDRLPPDQDIPESLGIAPETRPEKYPIITLASSHATDENLLIPAVKKVHNEHKGDFLLIIVPRHLERVPEITALLEKHQLSYQVHSHQVHPKPNPHRSRPPVLIFDKMGSLFRVLKMSHLVFMGGTTEEKIGGHNLYEPAVMGKPMMGGPHYNNFPDIGEALVNAGAYRVVTNSDQCRQQLLEFLGKFSGEFSDTAAIRAVEERRGSIQCILDDLSRIIPQDQPPMK